MNATINNLDVFTEGDEKKEAIIFVHGYPYDHLMWDEQVKTFSKDFYCVRYDIRGLGKSPVGDGQFTIEMFVDDLEKIINELKLDKAVLCGLSMGGYISLRAIERMEEKFSGLILCDTKSEADNNAGKLKRAEGIKKINEKGKEIFVEEFVRNCFADSFVENNFSEYEKVLNRSKQTFAEGLKGCLLAMAGRTDTTGYLSLIKIPTLVICGSEDKLTPPTVIKEMADKINSSNFVVVEGAGHMAPIEKPEVVTDVIKNFLRTNKL
jgi:3-oxoadipate enol-lactonase